MKIKLYEREIISLLKKMNQTIVYFLISLLIFALVITIRADFIIENSIVIIRNMDLVEYCFLFLMIVIFSILMPRLGKEYMQIGCKKVIMTLIEHEEYAIPSLNISGTGQIYPCKLTFVDSSNDEKIFKYNTENLNELKSGDTYEISFDGKRIYLLKNVSK